MSTQQGQRRPLGPKQILAFNFLLEGSFVLVAFVWIVWVKGGDFFALLQPAGDALSRVGAGLGVGVGLLALLLVGRAALPFFFRFTDEIIHILGRGLNLGGYFAVAISAAVGEELFFRGAIQGSFGIIVASLASALAHTPPTAAVLRTPAAWLYALFAFIGAVAFGLLYIWSGDLLASMLAHFTVDFLVGVLAVRGVLGGSASEMPPRPEPERG